MCDRATFFVGSLLAGLICLALVPCCDTVEDLAEDLALPRELPTETTFVMSNKSMFAQGDDDSLANVVAGTVIDELSNLTGCWGAYAVFGAPSTGPLLHNYEFYRFEVSQGEMEYQVYQEDVRGLVGAFVGETSVFSVAGRDRLRVLGRTSITHSDPDTGELERREGELEPPVGGDVLLVTVSGDKLKIRPAENDDDVIDQREDLVFTRFECP